MKNKTHQRDVSLWVIFRSTFIIGLTTFGGGYSMVAQMQNIFVDKYRLLTNKDMADFFAVATSIPGVVATNVSIFLGYKLRGVKGATVAAIASVLPSFFVLCLVTVFYNSFLENKLMHGALRGFRAAVVALLLSAGLKLRPDSIVGKSSYVLLAIGFALSFFINPAWVILGSILVGLLFAKRGGVK